MTKNILLFSIILMMLLSVSSFAGFKMTAWGGYHSYLGKSVDLPDDADKGGLAFGFKGGMTFTQLITIGLIGGYMPLYSFEKDYYMPLANTVKMGKIKHSANNFFTDLMLQIKFGGPYILGGFGVNVVKTDYSLTINPAYTSIVPNKNISQTDLFSNIIVGIGFEKKITVLILDAGVYYSMLMVPKDDIINRAQSMDGSLLLTLGIGLAI